MDMQVGSFKTKSRGHACLKEVGGVAGTRKARVTRCINVYLPAGTRTLHVNRRTVP